MTPQALAELDLAVAKAEGSFIGSDDYAGSPIHVDGTPYQPTRDPVEAMRLLEKYKIDVRWEQRTSDWIAGVVAIIGLGPTPCIAICRAVVAIHKKESA